MTIFASLNIIVGPLWYFRRHKKWRTFRCLWHNGNDEKQRLYQRNGTGSVHKRRPVLNPNQVICIENLKTQRYGAGADACYDMEDSAADSTDLSDTPNSDTNGFPLPSHWIRNVANPTPSEIPASPYKYSSASK